jgi:hypothetical protein
MTGLEVNVFFMDRVCMGGGVSGFQGFKVPMFQGSRVPEVGDNIKF